MASAIFAALTATSITVQAASGASDGYNGWYFNYNTDVATLGSKITGGVNYQQGTLAGLQIGTLAGSLTLGTGLTFGNDDPSTDPNVVPFQPSITNYSILIADSKVTSSETTAGIAITIDGSASIGASLPPKLTTLTGISVLSDAFLDLNNLETGSLAVTLGQTGTSNTLQGLDLVGADLSAGGTYIGATTASTADKIEIFAIDNGKQGGNAYALKIGTGTYQVSAGASGGIDAQATATASATTKLGLTAYGATISTGGALTDAGAATTGATTLKGTVTYAGLTLDGDKTLTGVTATAAGATMNGGAISLGTKATAAAGDVTIKGEVITDTANKYFAGTATAYGINAQNDANVEIGTVSGGITISGTVAATAGTLATANAYGIYAAGSDVTIKAGSGTNAISGTVGTNAALSTVTQTAAGIWAEDDSTIDIAGGSGAALTITGENQSVAADTKPGTIKVYGIYAQDSTLNLTGQVTLTAKPQTQYTTLTEVQKEQYEVYGLYAENTTITVSGQNDAASPLAGVVISDGGVDVSGKPFTVQGGDAGETGAGGDSTFTVGGSSTSADFTANDVTLLVSGGNGTASYEGGDATFNFGNNGGNFSFTGGSITVEAGTANATAGSTATMTVGKDTSHTGSFVVSGSEVNVTGGTADGALKGATATLNVF